MSSIIASPFRESWDYYKIKLKEKFPTLSDEDFNHEPGKSHEMFNHLQTKTGKNPPELAAIIATIIQGDSE